MSENTSIKSGDLRARRSRKYLIEALFTLVQVKPLQKITVRHITDEAMVNRSTFYAHFVDKYDLFKNAIGHRMQHEFRMRLNDSTGFTYTNLCTLILVSGKLMTKTLTECQQSSVDELLPLILNEMQNSIYDVVSIWTNTLTISKTEAKELAIFTTGVVYGAVSLWGKQSDKSQSIEELAEQIMPLLMDGIRQYTD